MTKLLLGAGCDVEARDREGLTPLYHAALGHPLTGALPTLLGVGANVNARLPDKANVLIAFCRGWAWRASVLGLQSDVLLNIVRLLFAHGAQPRMVDEQGRTAIIAVIGSPPGLPPMATSPSMLPQAAEFNFDAWTGVTAPTAVPRSPAHSPPASPVGPKAAAALEPRLKQLLLDFQRNAEAIMGLLVTEADLPQPPHVDLPPAFLPPSSHPSSGTNTPTHTALPSPSSPSYYDIMSKYEAARHLSLRGRPLLLRMLIEKGVPLFPSGARRTTPCHAAAWAGCPVSLNLILQQVSTIDVDAGGVTPMHVCLTRLRALRSRFSAFVEAIDALMEYREQLYGGHSSPVGSRAGDTHLDGRNAGGKPQRRAAVLHATLDDDDDEEEGGEGDSEDDDGWGAGDGGSQSGSTNSGDLWGNDDGHSVHSERSSVQGHHAMMNGSATPGTSLPLPSAPRTPSSVHSPPRNWSGHDTELWAKIAVALDAALRLKEEAHERLDMFIQCKELFDAKYGNTLHPDRKEIQELSEGSEEDYSEARGHGTSSRSYRLHRGSEAMESKTGHDVASNLKLYASSSHRGQPLSSARLSSYHSGRGLHDDGSGPPRRLPNLVPASPPLLPAAVLKQPPTLTPLATRMASQVGPPQAALPRGPPPRRELPKLRFSLFDELERAAFKSEEEPLPEGPLGPAAGIAGALEEGNLPLLLRYAVLLNKQSPPSLLSVLTSVPRCDTPKAVEAALVEARKPRGRVRRARPLTSEQLFQQRQLAAWEAVHVAVCLPFEPVGAAAEVLRVAHDVGTYSGFLDMHQAYTGKRCATAGGSQPWMPLLAHRPGSFPRDLAADHYSTSDSASHSPMNHYPLNCPRPWPPSLPRAALLLSMLPVRRPMDWMNTQASFASSTQDVLGDSEAAITAFALAASSLNAAHLLPEHMVALLAVARWLFGAAARGSGHRLSLVSVDSGAAAATEASAVTPAATHRQQPADDFLSAFLGPSADLDAAAEQKTEVTRALASVRSSASFIASAHEAAALAVDQQLDTDGDDGTPPPRPPSSAAVASLLRGLTKDLHTLVEAIASSRGASARIDKGIAMKPAAAPPSFASPATDRDRHDGSWFRSESPDFGSDTSPVPRLHSPFHSSPVSGPGGHRAAPKPLVPGLGKPPAAVRSRSNSSSAYPTAWPHWFCSMAAMAMAGSESSTAPSALEGLQEGQELLGDRPPWLEEALSLISLLRMGRQVLHTPGIQPMDATSSVPSLQTDGYSVAASQQAFYRLLVAFIGTWAVIDVPESEKDSRRIHRGWHGLQALVLALMDPQLPSLWSILGQLHHNAVEANGDIPWGEDVEVDGDADVRQSRGSGSGSFGVGDADDDDLPSRPTDVTSSEEDEDSSGASTRWTGPEVSEPKSDADGVQDKDSQNEGWRDDGAQDVDSPVGRRSTGSVNPFSTNADNDMPEESAFERGMAPPRKPKPRPPPGPPPRPPTARNSPTSTHRSISPAPSDIQLPHPGPEYAELGYQTRSPEQQPPPLPPTSLHEIDPVHFPREEDVQPTATHPGAPHSGQSSTLQPSAEFPNSSNNHKGKRCCVIM